VQAAVQIGYGAVDEAIVVREVPTPAPGPGEVLVRVAGATVNRKDLFALQNLTGPGIRPRAPLPHVGGADGWGEIAAIGPQTSGWAIGERVVVYPGLHCGTCEWCLRGEQSACVCYGVLGEQGPGCHAECVVVPVRNLERVPPDVRSEDLAAACASWLTAWRALIGVAHVRPGETLLVVGASGGVGTGAIRIGALAGCRVIAAIRGPARARRAIEIGAEAVVDCEAEDFDARVRELTGGRGADVVLDSVGAATWRRSINATAPFGRMVICGATSGDRPDISVREIYQYHRRILGAPLGSRADLRDLLRAIAAGKLAPVVHAVYPLSAVREALRALESRTVFGKIVLAP
jgi:NADPH2:quinone reductase